ncbi:MAG TPA: hypothetical protein VG826_19445 [Pirellulales bacterium]|nr:hypothetical protein [Pirellulales bacterium]
MNPGLYFRSGRCPRIVLLMTLCVAAPTAVVAEEPAAAGAVDYLRQAYRAEAEKCAFLRADGQPLTLLKEPIMRWTNDGDWSGDVFAWTYRGRPEVIGCILSGPGASNLRYIYDEFHLLAEKPIAAATIQDNRRWEPAEGLKVERLADAPKPADRASGRLVQMREMARSFKAYMHAETTWELRLLTQPLMRYGDEQSDVIDGALFAYVWTKGTDPELILLLECRRDDQELAWCFAPARFSNRGVWLKRADKDVWGVEGHQEPVGKLTTKTYTTAFARSMPDKRESRGVAPGQ